LKLNPTNEVKYRIKLAKHYLEEAREAFKRGQAAARETLQK